MKVLLIYPNYPGLGIGLDPFAWLAEPLPLETLAANIKDDHEVRIADLRFESKGLASIVDQFQPDVIGVTGHLTESFRIIDICRTVKAINPSIITIVGGHFATQASYAFDQDCIDAVVVGEGEITFPEILSAMDKGEDWKRIKGLKVNLPEGGQKFTGRRPLIKDINILKIPDRYRYDINRNNYNLFLERPHAICEFTRGCTHQCSFCSVHKYNHGKYRQMGVERIIKELETIKETSVAFIDDNFFCNLKRAEEVAKAIIPTQLNKKKYFLFGSAELVVKSPNLIELWKKAGMSHFYIGFESVNEDVGYNKKITIQQNLEALNILRKLDIMVFISFIVRPDFDRDDFKKLTDFCNKNDILYPLFPILVPFPGTDIHRDGYIKKQLLSDHYGLYDFLHSLFPTKLPREEFYDLYANMYKTIGTIERKKKVRWDTLKKSFPLNEINRWPRKIKSAINLLKLWQDMGKRMGKAEWYLKDDMRPSLRPPRKSKFDPLEDATYKSINKNNEKEIGCSRFASME